MAPKIILLVDDSEDDRIVFAAVLQYYGYQVLRASTAEEGTRIARESRPDLVLMDVRLPGMDGYQATLQLKNDPGTSSIPVVLVTLFDVDKIQLQAVRADGFLEKPCAPSALIAAVERVLGARVVAQA